MECAKSGAVAQRIAHGMKTRALGEAKGRVSDWQAVRHPQTWNALRKLSSTSLTYLQTFLKLQLPNPIQMLNSKLSVHHVYQSWKL